MENLKKILIIGAEVQPIPPVEGGAVELLVDFILRENETNKFAEISLISPYTEKAKQESKLYKNTTFYFIKGCNSIYAKLLNFIDLFNRKFFNYSSGIYYLHKALKIIKKQDFDTIIVENRPRFGAHIKKVFHGNLILHLHNDFINKDVKDSSNIINSYDKIITISNYLKNRILEVKNCDVETVYNGIDLSLYQNNQIKKNERKEIIYAGRLVREKGVIELVKAFSKIENNEILLTIIGSYDYGAENEKQFIKEFEELVSKDPKINVVGYVPNNEIYKYYKRAYVGVVPSIVNEALSLTAIEMLASGLPVICTDAGGLPEVVDEKCGIIVKRDQLESNLYLALLEIINKGYRAQAMSNHAQSKIKRFDRENYIESFKILLTNV